MLILALTPEQSHQWERGGRERQRLEDAIAERVQAMTQEDVIVTLDTGAIAYCLEQTS